MTETLPLTDRSRLRRMHDLGRFDVATIHAILDDEKNHGQILGYHKVRHRHNGAFHWVDMHLQVDGTMNVADSHALASRIERRIEVKLGRANATAHVEPYDPARDAPQTSIPDSSAPPGSAPASTPEDTPIVRNDPL